MNEPADERAEYLAPDHPLRTPVDFYYNAGGGKWELHSIGTTSVLEAIYVWLHVHNPQTLALGSTLYASLGGAPKWELLPGGAQLEFEVPASGPQAAIWEVLLVGLANNQFSHVCASTDCACGHADAPLVDGAAVHSLALCVRDGRIRIQFWLHSDDAAAAESVAKRARRMLLDVQFLPTSISFTSFKRLQARKKSVLARY